jgi:cell wall-associated NlpC family hydrolase
MEPFCSPCTSMTSPVRAVLTRPQAGQERRDQNRLGGTNGTRPQQPPELTLCPGCGAVDAGCRDVPASSVRPGDLAFFDGDGHVAVYIGGGKYVDAPEAGENVEVIPTSESWYASTLPGYARP